MAEAPHEQQPKIVSRPLTPAEEAEVIKKRDSFNTNTKPVLDKMKERMAKMTPEQLEKASEPFKRDPKLAEEVLNKMKEMKGSERDALMEVALKHIGVEDLSTHKLVQMLSLKQHEHFCATNKIVDAIEHLRKETVRFASAVEQQNRLLVGHLVDLKKQNTSANSTSSSESTDTKESAPPTTNGEEAHKV